MDKVNPVGLSKDDEDSEIILSIKEYEALRERDKEEIKDEVNTVIPPADIIAFNEQRSCADIYRMYFKDQIDINPDFQRGEVWNNRSQTLFIDSLIKQLPIPSMCISYDLNTHKRLVIDGLQRIITIIKFFDYTHQWKLSSTDAVDDRISGKMASQIKIESPELIEIVENVTIPITVLRCNYDIDSHMQYLFQIFNRLNSGGNKLYNQEIRNCIYQGPFNSLLKELARSDIWRSFIGQTIEEVDRCRMSNEEQILRFFAFHYTRNDYNGRMAQFLNKFMYNNKTLDLSHVKAFENLFNRTMNIASLLADKPTSKNVIDAVLVGIANNLCGLSNINTQQVSTIYDRICKTSQFSEQSLSEGLASREKVLSRINTAISLFSGNEYN